MDIHYLSEGFLLGLATGHLCIATCGPIYTPFLMQRKFNLTQSLFALLKISVGRFVTYLLFGIIAGLLGQQIGSINRAWFTAIAYLLFSTFLFISAFRTHQKEKGCQFKRWSNFVDSPFMLGVVTGINYCPSFLIALTRAVDLSGPVSGAMLFIAFFFGTNIFLLPFTFFGIMGNKKLFRTIAVIISFIVGSWFMYKAIHAIVHLVGEKSKLQTEFDKGNLVTLLDSTDTYILSDDTSSFIVLKDVLTEYKKEHVFLVSDTSGIVSRECYIFVDYKWNKTTVEALKREGRFVLVLSAPDKGGIYDREYGNKTVRFLDKFYFKWDKKSGTFFSMNKSTLITKQAEKQIN